METSEALQAQAEALREEAGNIGDRFGNMGPAARMRQTRLYKEANELAKQASALRAPRPKFYVGSCTCCGEQVQSHEVSEGYTACCNDSLR